MTLNEFKEAISAKLENNVLDALYKTYQSKNISVEDWNTLITQINNLSSDTINIINAIESIYENYQPKLSEINEGQNVYFTIDDDGNVVINATGGSGGSTVVQGNGIVINDLASGAKEINIDSNTIATKSDVTNEAASRTTADNSLSFRITPIENAVPSDASSTNKMATASDIQNVREVAEGKCKTYIIDTEYDNVPEDDSWFALHTITTLKGQQITSFEEFEEYTYACLGGLGNSSFNSNNTVNIASSYLMFGESEFGQQYIIKYDEFDDVFKKGDIFLVIQTDVPDRWYGGSDSGVYSFYKLETSKIDLTNYAKLTGNNTFSGINTFINKIQFKYNSSSTTNWSIVSSGDFSFDFKRNNSNILSYITTQGMSIDCVFYPANTNIDLGKSDHQWNNGYFSGTVYAENTFNVINASDIVDNTLTQAQYDLITNGKPTIIKGTLLSQNNLYVEPIFTLTGSYVYARVMTSSAYPAIIQYVIRIHTTTRVISLESSNNIVRLNNIGFINNKSLPAYPSSPANNKVLTYKTDNTLGWTDAGGAVITVSTQESLAQVWDAGTTYDYTYNGVTTISLAGLNTKGYGDPIWKCKFKAGTDFTFSFSVSGATLSWLNETPTFTAGKTYIVMITKGLASNTYIAVCGEVA